MKYKKLDDLTDIKKDNRIKTTVKDMGNVVSVRYVSRVSKKTIRVLPGREQYIRLKDGSVHDIKHAETRKDNIKSVRETIGRLREIINTNCTDANKIRWLTLTYAENMTDPKRLAADFKKFIRKIRDDYPSIEYIAVAEPQGRGAWHMHVILIFPHRAPFIDNSDVQKKYWSDNGFTKTKAVDKNCDNLGAYFSAYLADMKVEDMPENAVVDEPVVVERVVDGEKKSIIKGGRLHMYPAGFNFYRCSRGIKRPEPKKMTLAQADEYVKGFTEVYSTAYVLEDEESGFNFIVYDRQYNKKRKPTKMCYNNENRYK